MRVLFIDPGTTRSAWVTWETSEGLDGCLGMGLEDNEVVLDLVRCDSDLDHVVIEEIQSYGMPVGRDVFQTVIWSGRFIQAHAESWELLPRREVKLQLCGSSRAKDSNIRQALIDIMGPAPTKKKPNPRWPAKPRKDIWAAAAMAIAWLEMEAENAA